MCTTAYFKSQILERVGVRDRVQGTLSPYHSINIGGIVSAHLPLLEPSLPPPTNPLPSHPPPPSSDKQAGIPLTMALYCIVFYFVSGSFRTQKVVAGGFDRYSSLSLSRSFLYILCFMSRQKLFSCCYNDRGKKFLRTRVTKNPYFRRKKRWIQKLVEDMSSLYGFCGKVKPIAEGLNCLNGPKP